MPPIVRLADRQTKQRLVVDLERSQVLGDTDGDGRISRAEELPPKDAQPALDAARQLDTLFVEPFPGATTPDGRFQSGGVLNTREVAALDAGGSVPQVRTQLQEHLDFFDRGTRDGKITLKENYEGWRELGTGRLGSWAKTAGSSLIFGQARHGFSVDLEKIGEKRRKGSTGLFDKQGVLDETKLEAVLREFDARGQGTLTPKQVMEVLKAQAPKEGKLSKSQFKSLFEVCERINGDKVVTKEQFRAFFDGSLLYRAASMTDHQGHRRLRE